MEADLRRRPMRIAAGGLLLLAAFFDLLIALGHVFPGVFPTRLGWSLQGEIAAGAGVELIETLGGAEFLGRLAVVSAGILFIGAISVLSSQYAKVIFIACTVAIVTAIRESLVAGLGVTFMVALVGGGLGLISGLRIQLARPGDEAAPVDTGRVRSVGDWMAVAAVVGGLALLALAAILLAG